MFELPSGRDADISSKSKRLRGEKRPIPEDQKDEKYFERRRRNNQAAKKSRDARKFREDQVNIVSIFCYSCKWLNYFFCR